MSRLYKQYKEQKELINDLLEQVSAEVNRNVENCTNLHIKEKKDKETMEYQDARIKALEDKIQQLEKHNKDLSWLLGLTEQELCEKKESLKRALKYSGAL